jgi:hypothetical protein
MRTQAEGPEDESLSIARKIALHVSTVFCAIWRRQPEWRKGDPGKRRQDFSCNWDGNNQIVDTRMSR